jgi:hypothetical protein
MRQAFESEYGESLVFEHCSTGEKALYLERGEDGSLYLCDTNDRWVVESDEQIDADVAYWRHLWDCRQEK